MFFSIHNAWQASSWQARINIVQTRRDLVIRACQLDVFWQFGSSYCYNNIYIYYIPINVISLETVDFTVLRITTLWFTDLWNWWRSTQCFSQYTRHEVLWRHSYRTTQICIKYFICFKMKPINHTPKHIRMSLMNLEWFSTQDIVCIKKLTLVLFKNVFFYTKSIENKRWTVDLRLFQS